MKDIAVYTVIVDDYDPLREPLHRQLLEEADFYCFTNDQITSDFYTVVPIEKIYGDATLTNRYYKILLTPILSDYKYTIYIDGSFQITAPTIKLLIEEVLGNHDIALFKHQSRTCVYEEAKAVILRRKADYRSVYRHMKRYRQEGYPKDFGLIEASIIIRNNQSVRLKGFVEAWWQEFYHNAHRDQLSFNYVLWKYPIDLAYIPGSVPDNEFFKFFIRPKKLPPKTLYEKVICRYWTTKIDLL